MCKYEAIYEKINIPDINILINKLSFKKDLIVLKSSMVMQDHGRYSYICFDSFATFIAKNNFFYWNNVQIEIDNPFDFIDEKINEYKIIKNDLLPLLQGGAVGYFGYEAGHYLEELPPVTDNIQLPDIYLSFYSNIIAIDHEQNQSWIIATGFPEKEDTPRKKIAKKSLNQIRKLITQTDSVQYANDLHLSVDKLTSNFNRESYIHAVLDTKEYILNGDVFEVNISQQFSAKTPIDMNSVALYLKLMQFNPAPYSALIKIPGLGSIISASPERFIKLVGQAIETFPIKGTRKRSKDKNTDEKLAQELLSSEKDIAENVMIVDLMRNDISRVCQPGSIKVDELCALKSFETVHHLVSKITGVLKQNKNAIDLLKATFPPGSVTGAPKIRAMEIISEQEKQERGPYCGSIGYLSFTGDMDTSVIIRTYFLNDTHIFFSAGGAIVLDSDPNEEYLESLAKAQSLIEVLTQ